MTRLHAHAGVDHGDNCFIHIAGEKLRLGGFQSKEKIGGGKHFCHLFPDTGKVIYTFDQKHKNQQLSLKFLAPESYWDIVFDYDQAFPLLLTQSIDTPSIQHVFPNMGIYALEVSLQSKQAPANQLLPSQNNTQRFLFVVGFPIIKILVFIAFGFLLLLCYVLLKQLKTGTPRQS